MTTSNLDFINSVLGTDFTPAELDAQREAVEAMEVARRREAVKPYEFYTCAGGDVDLYLGSFDLEPHEIGAQLRTLALENPGLPVAYATAGAALGWGRAAVEGYEAADFTAPVLI